VDLESPVAVDHPARIVRAVVNALDPASPSAPIRAARIGRVGRRLIRACRWLCG
jgi:hypothetical protein